MAETKRVSDEYKISAPTIILDGNLTVIGSTTSVETVNSTVTDNIIILNSGEQGVSGITAGSAGIQIDRGSGGEEATILFEEASGAFLFKTGTIFANVRGASPVALSDFATKDYVDSGLGSVPAGGTIYSVQFNNGTSIDGDIDFLWDGTTLVVKDVEITTGKISRTTTNGDLEISANGAGTLFLRSVLKLENEVSDPASTAGSNKVYAKTPGNAGSGVYFVNTTATGELVSKSKAILFGLIF